MIDARLTRGADPSWILLAAAATAGVLFVVVAALVVEGVTLNFDRGAILSLRTADPGVIAGPAWFGPLMLDATALGGTPIMTLLTLLLAGYLIVRRKWSACALLIVVVVGQAIAVDALKAAFDRPRPDFAPRLAEVSSRSFPSGHAASSASVFLLLAAMLAPSLPSQTARLYALFVAIVLALLVGMSRVALGVHYPSDVLAGWSFGVAWTSGWTVAARKLKWL